MNKEDRRWLIGEFPDFQGNVIKGATKNAYMKAELLITGTASAPDCNCGNNRWAAKIDKLYSEWLKEQNTSTPITLRK